MTEATLLVGRGLSDITGEAGGCGMLGYGKADQQTEGIHMRQRTRAFVIATGAAGPRVLLIVNDLPLVFDSVHQEVLRRLRLAYGDLYSAANTMITATHTHCAPGGYADHLLYNSNTKGFRPKTFDALVDGILEAVVRAHADLAPSRLVLAHGELHGASVNRSRVAFERNPQTERAFFPEAIDPQTTLLRIERAGRTVGAINWFATHNTSMTNRNRLISSDNKGYAGYYWERVVGGLNYLTDLDSPPPFIGAFAQTNAGDMSPNLNLRPGSGPTEDAFENTRLIGLRQYDAASALAGEDGVEVTGPLDARLVYVDLARVDVEPAFTGDGRAHRTSGPAGGSASFAGAGVDGPAFRGFAKESIRGGTGPRIAYRSSRSLADTQAPKGIVLPGGLVNRLLPVVAQRVPVQLLRIGPLYLIGIPGEVTITAGLRLRRTVAAVVGAELHNVLVAGYSNGYIHYVTTPEEYDAQRYEGASTLFGRWELPALQQTVAKLADRMQTGSAVEEGPPTVDLSHRRRPPRDRSGPDTAPPGTSFGDVVVEPRDTYEAGQRVTITFVGAHPDNRMHRGGTYLHVQRWVDEGWQSIRDDGDWDTRFVWKARPGGASEVTISWDIAGDAPAGRYRILYCGESRAQGGALRSFAGESPAFAVTGAAGPATGHEGR